MHARVSIVFALLCAALLADAGPAQKLYNSARYEKAIEALKGDSSKAGLQLTGQSWFMLGEFKKATEVFEKALEASPNDSDLHAWLGRAYGRRAETANPLAAPRYASKARQYFEKSVQLNPKNILALNDLFEYYLQAPGFLGGGKDKAAKVAAQIADLDKAEGYYAHARLAEDRREFSAAEQQLRRAIEAAPTQAGRVLDLAKFLAKQGRVQESDVEFARAEKLAPNSPKVMFERAVAYIEAKRNRDVARTLLQKYIESPLTPDDPPRQEAERLLRGM